MAGAGSCVRCPSSTGRIGFRFCGMIAMATSFVQCPKAQDLTRVIPERVEKVSDEPDRGAPS